MAIHYQHTQRGTLMLVVLTAGALALAAMAYVSSAPSRWLCLALACGFVILTWLFSSLTVIVNANELRWYFGPGFWQYRMTLGEISTARVVRNSWTNGFGIRIHLGFRLYNVSGLDAVELKLNNGDVRRIGTDDAPALVAALSHA